MKPPLAFLSLVYDQLAEPTSHGIAYAHNVVQQENFIHRSKQKSPSDLDGL
jgi:hypothetical protein